MKFDRSAGRLAGWQEGDIHAEGLQQQDGVKEQHDAVPTSAATRVSRPLTNSPMRSARCVNIRSAIMGIGKAMLSTTWLITSAFVALTPRPTTTKAGTIVTNRRTQTGMRKPTKPCMII